MSITSNKTVTAAIAIAVAGVGAYWHYSPYLALKSMRTAAEKKDADALNAHVDYPKLRESIKGQLSAKLAEQRGSAPKGGNGMEALGAVFAMALVNPMIDAMVRPEFVMSAMTKGEIEVVPGSVKEAVRVPEQKTAEPKWEFDRQGADKLVVFALDPEGKDQTKAGLVFERSGFADWKLTEVRLPSQ